MTVGRLQDVLRRWLVGGPLTQTGRHKHLMAAAWQ